MVANTVYSTTHDGLTRLVSARVASQVLDSALRAARCSADTVSATEMASVIKGSVVRELSAILPRAGLETSLKKLLKTLKALPADEAVATEAEIEAAPDGLGSDDTATEDLATKGPASEDLTDENVAVADVTVETVTAETATVETATAKDPADSAATAELLPDTAAEPSFPEQPVGEPVRATDLEPAPRAPLVLGPTARDEALLVFAQLEHVEMVAAFEGGSVASVRGGGFEVEALSRLATLGLKLLGRSGELRTFYVAHSRGQLFLFPFGEVTLMLIGSAELNLGLVFATLHKLKEEL